MVRAHRTPSEKSYLLGAHKVTLRQHQVIRPRGAESAAGAGGDRNLRSQGDAVALTLDPRGAASSTRAIKCPSKHFASKGGSAIFSKPLVLNVMEHGKQYNDLLSPEAKQRSP